ncbi:uncharacterized protein LOC144025437 isoform X1 [Festucalex cinctus]
MAPIKDETAVEEFPPSEVPSVDLATSMVEVAPPSLGEALEKDPKQEYNVVILENTLVAEDALPQVDSTPAIEETASVVQESVDEETMAPIKDETAVEEFPPSQVPSVDLATSMVEVAPPSLGEALEKDPKQEYIVVVLENTLVAEDALPQVDSTPAIEETASVVQESVDEETMAPIKDETAVEEFPPSEVPSVDLATSMVEVAPPSLGEALEKDPKQEYIVVVLEGTLKPDRSPKVLGVAPLSGRIIPAPEDEDRRHLLRIQMQ